MGPVYEARPGGTTVTPYYEDDAVTIYHGDWRSILPSLGRADLVLTDPPYGIAGLWSKGSEVHGWAKANAQMADRNVWDATVPTTGELAAVVAKGRQAVVWGGNYFGLPPTRGWLVWNKPERGFSLAEAELAWTSRDAVIRVFDHNRSDPGRVHPTQKPLDLMRWCLELFPQAQTVLDPYMGSGTTLRAAKDCGRKAVGIELDERWCEVAAKRMAQEVLAL